MEGDSVNARDQIIAEIGSVARRFQDGESAGTIAKTFPGASRGLVIGLLWRRGIRRKGGFAVPIELNYVPVPPVLKGEDNPQARLTTAMVLAIRESTEPRKVLARRYGVSAAQVSNIRRRRLWKHLP